MDVGLGFYVEFTRQEALDYISQREERIKKYDKSLLFFVPNAAFLKVVKILFVALRCCLLLGEFKENIVVLSYLMNELSGRMHYNAECGLLYKWWFLVLQTTRRVYWCYYADQRAHQTGKFEFFSRFVKVVHCLMRLDLTRKPLYRCIRKSYH